MPTQGETTVRGEQDAGQDQCEEEGQGMIVVRLLKRSIQFGLAVALVSMFASVPAAFALSPWWHLTSGSRPTNLHAGLARSEVQEVTVSATGGEFILVEPVAYEKGELVNGNGELEFARFSFDAEAGVLQEGLEGIYGSGNVVVTGGPGDEKGTAPYVISFTGALADQPVKQVLAFNQLEDGAEQGSVSVTEAMRGRPDGEVVVTAANLGDENVSASATPVQITDTLPHGLRAVAISARTQEGISINAFAQLKCTVGSLTCEFTGSVPPYQLIEMRISVVVESGASSGEVNEAGVTGGGAPDATIKRPIVVSEAPTPFGIEDYELTAEDEGGASSTQAGSHPFQLTTTLNLNQVVEESKNGRPSLPEPALLTKDLNFKLPPGLIGNPSPFAQCTMSDFYADTKGTCPSQTVVGVAMITIAEPAQIGVATLTVPLFNLEPSAGEPARFGFRPEGVPVFLDTSVRTGGDYGVTVSVDNITQEIGFLGSEVTFWGVPGDPRHDSARGENCLQAARGASTAAPCRPLEQRSPPPFLALPTSCTGPLQTVVEADSWQQEGVFGSFPTNEPLPALDGCNRLPFGPSISVAPDGQAGSTPTGLTVGVHVPQDASLNAAGLSEADVRDTTVALPAGVALNPAAADGLQTCTDMPEPGRPEGQLALNSDAAASCPEASKVATLEINTPLLPNPLVGAAYLAAQDANPFGSLVALYFVAEDPVSGTLVKLAGEVKPDPLTGQLVSTFKNTPQLPFEDLKLHFFGGDRAPLSTPAACGSYTTVGSIAPWSGNPATESSSTFNIVSGPNGSPCASPLPFSPSLTAGTTSIQAGGFSPFTMTMSREDGQQSLQSIQLKMPPGLSGLLSSVKLCGEPQADQGLCGPESEIGETIVSVGLGGDPYSVRGGKVFVTEGYDGAPYGLSIVNPAKAGPYDLERETPCDCVVVRAKIEVDPLTAALTITTDSTGPYKIPTIIDGIPLQIKHVNVTINRPGFTFNPTNCNPMSITGSLSSTQGATSTLSVPLQVTNCAVLGFKPAFSVSTNGKTSRAMGASLHVKLVYPKARFGSQANIRSVKVDLPKQLPSNLKALQQACPIATFRRNPALCSAESRVGEAKAMTPLLPVPLTGPAYFVSNAGLAFPELVIVLSGYGTTVQLHAETFINPKTNITSSTFRTVPDAPIGTFELTLPQGKFSALSAPFNLCKTRLKMPTAFTAQNGAVIKQSTPITVTGCAKATKKNKKTHKAKGK
ncbi:MAG TPA: hypothetical protein VK781_06895 [Solirubrobacteraceae bacterium]|nr:hypothetical protein [Solirubrobacteraceae bacterium]